MHFELSDYDPGNVEGYIDPDTGRASQDVTPALQAIKDDTNYDDPTGQISRRRVEGEYIFSYFRNELMWRISRVDGQPMPDTLYGRYTSAYECEKAIATYNVRKGTK